MQDPKTKLSAHRKGVPFMSFHSVQIQLLKTLNNAPFPYPRLGNALAQIDSSSISVSVALAAQPRSPSPVNGERAPLCSGILHSLARSDKMWAPLGGKQRDTARISLIGHGSVWKSSRNRDLTIRFSVCKITISQFRLITPGRFATQLRSKRRWYLIIWYLGP